MRVSIRPLAFGDDVCVRFSPSLVKNGLKCASSHRYSGLLAGHGGITDSRGVPTLARWRAFASE